MNWLSRFYYRWALWLGLYHAIAGYGAARRNSGAALFFAVSALVHIACYYDARNRLRAKGELP